MKRGLSPCIVEYRSHAALEIWKMNITDHSIFCTASQFCSIPRILPIELVYVCVRNRKKKHYKRRK